MADKPAAKKAPARGRLAAPRNERSRFVAADREASEGAPQKTLQKLSERHELFCLEYVRTQSALKAYGLAGFTGEARQSAWRLRHDPLIDARIKQLMAEKFARLHMDVDEILARAAMLARSDIRGLIAADGSVVDLSDLDETASYAVAGVEVVEMKGQDGEVTAVTKKVRLRDPLPALRILAEHKKLIGTPADQVNSAIVAIADRLKAARERARAAPPATTPKDLT